MNESNPTEHVSLKNHFLIAMPSMADPNFAQTLTYICEHNEHGAMGIVINRPLEVMVGEVLEQLNIEDYAADFDHLPVLCGGPVQLDRGFVLHRDGSQWDASSNINEGLCITSSRDILDAIAHGRGPEESLIALGYAGWGDGQLDEEMAQNAWLSVQADPDIIFNTPFEQRWQAAASLLGIDLSLLSMETGHA